MSDERPAPSDQPGHQPGQQEGRQEGRAQDPATEQSSPTHEPAAATEPVWDPWAPPRDAGPAPVAPDQPDAATPVPDAPHHDRTQPVDLSHTQEIPRAPEAPVWASEPTGWPTQGDRTASGRHPAAGTAAPPTPPAAGPATGWDPISTTSADAGYASQHGHWVGGQPVASSAPQQKGPGWGALVAVAAVAALVAATLGGMFGGWLGATDRIGFGNLDRTGTSIPSAGAGATARPEGTIANIAARALPSVVTIKVKGADGAGTGSGFVLDRDGHIVTNNHVVASAADGGTIAVELSNGTEIEATIVGRDSSYDLAVLKTSRTDLVPLVIGSSKDVVVGDQVIAVGAPLGLESSVTSGIVSALNRPVSPGGDGDQQSFINAIQTDAAINPGNSGGPLLDMQGHVIGINSAIARVPGAADVQSGNIGVGFSIPSDQVAKTAAQLIKTGKAEHPIIGVVLDRQYTGTGVKILASGSGTGGDPVSKDGPADKAGIKPGDVIVEFDGRPVSDADDLVVAIRAKSVGDAVPMKLRRGSETISVTVTLSGTSGS